MSLQQVKVPGLEHYITEAITSDRLRSTYYVGEAPIIYFLARWYRGKGYARLIEKLQAELSKPPDSHNALMLALLITAGCYLKVELHLLEPAIKHLLQLQISHWPAEALYLDPHQDGVQYYAGSPALTTAFALEALVAYDRLASTQPQAVKPNSVITMQKALTDGQNIASPQLRRRYQLWIRRLSAKDSDGQVTDMANITAQACGQQLPNDIALQLNLGSLNGWLAYTLYDNFWDDEGRPEFLGVANLAMRQALQAFRSALPNDRTFQHLLIQTFDQVDGANTWEVLQTRAIVTGHTIKIKRLPDYGNHYQLAQRSWGHKLAAVGTLVALGYQLDGPEVRSLQTFFRHFLIARQLNDDAHDWEDDLQRGHLSTVVTLLLKTYVNQPANLNLEEEMENLRLHFWQRTIETVADLISLHIHKAQKALASCMCLKNTQIYGNWLDTLEQATDKALHERSEAQKFMTAYAG